MLHGCAANVAHTVGAVGGMVAAYQLRVLIVDGIFIREISQHQHGGGDSVYTYGAGGAGHIHAPQGFVACLRAVDGSLPVAGGDWVVVQVDPFALRGGVKDDHNAIGALVVGIAADIEHNYLIADLVVAGVIPSVRAAGATQSRVVFPELDQTAVVIVRHLGVGLVLQIRPADLVDVVVGAVGVVVAVSVAVLLLPQKLLAGVDEGCALGQHINGGGQVVHLHKVIPLCPLLADQELVHQGVVIMAGHIVDGLGGAGRPAVAGTEAAADLVGKVAAAGGEAPGAAVVTGDGVAQVIVEEGKAGNCPRVVLGRQGVAVFHRGVANAPALAVEHDVGILGVDGVYDLVDRLGVDQACQIKAEAVDVVLLYPVHYGVHDEIPGHSPLGGQVVAHAGAVGPVALAKEAAEIVGNDLVVAEITAVKGVVINHIHYHVDAVGVEGLHHFLKFGDADTAVEGVGGVRALGNVVVLRVIAPCVLLPFVQLVFIVGIEVEGGHELYMGHAQLLQMLQSGGVAVVIGAGLGKSQISALPFVLDTGAFVDGHFPNVHLIDDGIGVGHTLIGADVIFPALGIYLVKVDDHAPVAVGTHRLCVGVGGFYGVVGEGHVEIIIHAMEVAGDGDRPHALFAQRHGDVLQKIVRAVVAGGVQLYMDILGGGSPHLEGCGIFAPNRTQIVAVIGIVRGEGGGVEQSVGGDVAFAGTEYHLMLRQLRKGQLTAQAQPVAAVRHLYAGNGGIRAGKGEGGGYRAGIGQGQLRPDLAGIVVVVGVGDLRPHDHIRVQDPAAGGRAGVDVVVHRAGHHITQVDEAVIEFLVRPVGLADQIARVGIGVAVHGEGGHQTLVVLHGF